MPVHDVDACLYLLYMLLLLVSNKFNILMHDSEYMNSEMTHRH